MELHQVSSNVYYFKSPVNVGYIHDGKTGLLIDTGLDNSAMKKILKQIDEKKLPLTHLFITHAHADHFGGAKYLQEKRDVFTIAPAFEEAILRYPKLEPLYLFHGVNPPPEMRNKFLEAKPMRVDSVVTEGIHKWGSVTVELIALPGHSDYQLGLLSQGILFAADSYMSHDVLNKHALPFLIDVSLTLKSLEKLLTLDAIGAIPGHGEYEVDFKDTVHENLSFYQTLVDSIYRVFVDYYPQGASLDNAIATISKSWGVELNNLGTWSLYRTAVTAYLMELCRMEKLTYSINSQILFFSLIKQ